MSSSPSMMLVLAFVFAACGPGPAGTGSDAAQDGNDAGGADADVDVDVDASPDAAATCPVMTTPCASGCCVDGEVIVSDGNGFAPDIALDSAGNLFVAYTSTKTSWQAVLAVRDAATGTWRDVQLGAGTYRNRVRVDAMGRVHVLAATNGLELRYQRSDDHGVTFSTPTTVGMVNGGGTFDLELDSTGAPHVAFAAKQAGSLLADLRYATFDGAAWSSVVIDATAAQNVNPDIALDAAGRPHIVSEAYNAGGTMGTTKRYHHESGGAWSSESIDAPGGAYFGDRSFAAHTLRVAADGTPEVLFTRSDDNVRRLLLARRVAGAWSEAPLATANDIVTPVMFVDHHGARGALSDGLRLHRDLSAWTYAALATDGRSAAVVRRDRFLYVAYITGTTAGKPAVAVVDLGP